MPTFTDSPFLTAAQKRRVLTQWRRFLQELARHFADKPRCCRAFGDALYRHLIQHCSFIAHYNRSGFFARYFERGDDAIRFLRQFDSQSNPEGASIEYGSSWWLSGDYADINTAMREAAAEFLPTIQAAAEDSQRTADLAHARWLAARHGLTDARDGFARVTDRIFQDLKTAGQSDVDARRNATYFARTHFVGRFRAEHPEWNA